MEKNAVYRFLAGPVKFGAKKGGATFNFFKESENPTYQSMYRYMSEHPEFMTSSNDQGLEWAKTDNYAFLMESSSIEYLAERNCEITQIGGLLDDKGYGIAMRQSWFKCFYSIFCSKIDKKKHFFTCRFVVPECS